MKILVANYRYFVSGGPERYMFNVTDALCSRGHEVIPFSVRYRQNEPTPYSRYFVPPLGSEDEVYFNDQRMSPRTAVKTLSRLFYSPEVKRAVRRLCEEARPDVAYVLHYLRKLSPSLLVALKEEGIPIAVRLSDYQMLCPQAHFLRDEKPCQLCSGNGLLPSIRHRCVKNSLPASTLNAMATWFHEAKGYFDLIDRFVVTNRFMLKAMLEAGYPEERLALIPTFVKQIGREIGDTVNKINSVVFVGRIEHLKGVHVLVEAAGLILQQHSEVGWSFLIAGDGDVGYMGQLQNRVAELGLAERMKFVGRLDGNKVSELLQSASLQVVPSIWFENLPNSLLEGFVAGTPAIVSDIGSLSETVISGENGYRFPVGNAQALANTLVRCWHEREVLAVMSALARSAAASEYGEDRHTDRLQHLFSTLLGSASTFGATRG